MTEDEFRAKARDYLEAHKDVKSFLASGFVLVNGIWQPVPPTTEWFGGEVEYVDPPKLPLTPVPQNPLIFGGVPYWSSPQHPKATFGFSKSVDALMKLYLNEPWHKPFFSAAPPTQGPKVVFNMMKPWLDAMKAVAAPADDWSSVFPSSETKFNPAMMVSNVSRDLIAESYRLDRRDEAERN